MPAIRCALVLTLVALTGCDMLGIESASAVAAKREADGKAVGAACRHAGRAIEDCYAMNRKTDKVGVFAGWREMNDYMRENSIEPVAPQLVAQGKSAAADEPREEPAVAQVQAQASASAPKKKKAS